VTEGETSGESEGLEDLSGLRSPDLADKATRDAAEAAQIDEAYAKYVYRGRPKPGRANWLSESLIRSAHRNMFSQVWDWAGVYRLSEKNIGVKFHQIPTEIHKLVGDFTFWNSTTSGMSTDEIGARLQHRLAWIHPFENGNGRHARLITDIFYRSRGEGLPIWPQIHRIKGGLGIRKIYVAAMKAADQSDMSELIQFLADCRNGTFED